MMIFLYYPIVFGGINNFDIEKNPQLLCNSSNIPNLCQYILETILDNCTVKLDVQDNQSGSIYPKKGKFS